MPFICFSILQEMQEMQQASQQAWASVQQQLQNDLQELSLAQQQLSARQEAFSTQSSTTGKRLQEVGQHIQQLDARLGAHATDMTGLAESVLGCLSAARVHAAAASQAPSSYLSNLLGPATPPTAVGTGKQLPWGAWVSLSQEQC